MVGIASWGVYFPFYRLKRGDIAKAWGQGFAPGGEKSVGNWDEDSITMAVAAANDCLKNIDKASVDGLIFATTTSPFREKQGAALIATAADLPTGIMTMDCTGSLRSATIAVKFALDAVKAGSAKKVLVVAADSRLGFPGSPFEMDFGDAAAALLISDTDTVATIDQIYTHYDEFTGLWRREDDRFVITWEDRFVTTHGYQDIIKQVIPAALAKWGVTPQDFAVAAIAAPNLRAQGAIRKPLGFAADPSMNQSIFSDVGNAGTALPLLLLVSALEDLATGGKALVASYGDGADVLMITLTGNKIEKTLEAKLANKAYLPTYLEYLSARRIVPKERGREAALVAPATQIWRERNSILRFHGSKCNVCGEVQFPIQRICSKCNSKDDFAEIKLADQKGKVFSASQDSIVGSPEEPPLMSALVDFDGLRVKITVTDDAGAVTGGVELEPTFRKLLRSGTFPTYAWKCKLAR